MKGIDINELPDRYRDQAIRQIAGSIRVSSAAAHVEPNPGDAPHGQKEATRYNGPTCIRISEYRHRKTDFDGSSIKYLIDALVSAKVLFDDSPAFVSKIEKEQIKVPKEESERTVVEIWET